MKISEKLFTKKQKKIRTIYRCALWHFKEVEKSNKKAGIIDIPYFIKAMGYLQEVINKGLVDNKFEILTKRDSIN